MLYTFCLHFYLINIHVFDYPDSRLSGLFTEVPTSPDNRGSTVVEISYQVVVILQEVRLNSDSKITDWCIINGDLLILLCHREIS